jgi:hypothetical protein
VLNKFVKGVAVIILALQIITFSACSSKSSASSIAIGSNSFGTDTGSADGISGHTAAGSGSTVKGSYTSSSATVKSLASAVSRKIVKSAELSLTTLTYDKSVTAIENAVNSYGGFVQNSTTQGEGASGNRTASFTVRVPTTKFSAFIDSAGKYGKVVSRSVKGDDVTQEYLDTSTRLTTLKTEQTRLVELLSKATKMSDILEIEQKLSDIETSIEQYTGELKKWDSLVDLSTVNINISEVKKGEIAKPDTFVGTVADVFTQSVSALVMTAKIICYVIIAILPFAVIIGIISEIVFLLRHRRKKRDAQNPADEHIIDDNADDSKK